jgi:hypothetical protein
VRGVCERCGADLHSCRNCAFYEPGADRDCREPSAEPVPDKERANFCDFFRFAEAPPGPAAARSAEDARSRLEELFRKKV